MCTSQSSSQYANSIRNYIYIYAYDLYLELQQNHITIDEGRYVTHFIYTSI